jgi:N-acetyltransferase
VIGSTRFWNLERWTEQTSPPRIDACEIGYSWPTRSAIRTAANTEAKLLMLAYAFEDWQGARVCFHADARNERSQAALVRIGASFEGVLRAHRLAIDGVARDSARFSIIASEWPTVKRRLLPLLKER